MLLKMHLAAIFCPFFRAGCYFVTSKLPYTNMLAASTLRYTRISRLFSKTAMEDEYGEMDSTGKRFTLSEYKLECGKVLKQAQVCYNTWGALNEKKDNAMVVCHALTGNSRLDTWWGGLLGPGKVFDTEKYFVICANVIGSCYGSTSHASINPDTGHSYGIHFGPVTVRDNVGMHIEMVKGIGVQGVASVIGGSLGGMQALEWACLAKDYIRSAVAIGCGATHTSWQIAVSEAQRQAIYADPKWQGGSYDRANPPSQGLSVARQIAMVTYRSAQGYHKKFGRERCSENTNKFKVRTYLEYQGEKFLSRFDPLSYVQMTELMDSHDLGRGRGGVAAALASITTPFLVIGIDSDILYPLWLQEELVDHIPDSELKIVKSIDGHDAFLLEQEQVSGFIKDFLHKNRI